jgi:mannose-1-phosphate guanylyltransferase
MNNNYCIIMAGGIGSRFWPLSTPSKPKQFLDVLGIGKSLLQMTFERLTSIAPPENIYIVTNVSYSNLVQEQLPEINRTQILTEPIRKNTAPCIAYASSKIFSINPDATLIIAPSDHLILNEKKFTNILEIAIRSAVNEDRLVTLGIKPTRPDTGYGYIEFEAGENQTGGQVRKVINFKEKPILETAQLFVDSGNYYWNSGIFVWKASTILNALKTFKPKLFQLFSAENNFYNTEKEQDAINKCFEFCEDISIDFAVMEKAQNVDVVLADFDWSDLGTWVSLYQYLEKDKKGNAVIGENIQLVNSKNCLINLSQNKQAIIEGLDNHIVVESDNMLLILSKNDEQNLKKYLENF